jgi:16S rRNA (uracil1498-N3)-methyltransferase
VTSSAEAGGTLLVTPGDLDGERCEVRGAAYRHLFRARRLATGESVRVVDGAGRARTARVGRVGRDAATLELGPEAPGREPEAALTLLVGALRPQRASWLVEKATELGVVAVRFLATERGARDFGAGTFERLRRVAAAAVEQCGRARLPEVTGVHPWGDLSRLVADCAARWICEADAAEEPARAPQGTASCALVGSEGGWTAAELAAAAALGCRPLALGPRPLRVETAALAAAALLLSPGSVDTPERQS